MKSQFVAAIMHVCMTSASPGSPPGTAPHCSPDRPYPLGVDPAQCGKTTTGDVGAGRQATFTTICAQAPYQTKNSP